MRKRRGWFRRKKKKDEDLKEVVNDLNSLFGETEVEKPQEREEVDRLSADYVGDISEIPDNQVIHGEVFRLTEEEKRQILETETYTKSESEVKYQTRSEKVWGFIKKNVRPDVGLASPFAEGEGPDLQNDDIYEIGDKLRKNLRVGLKLTMKF